MAHWPVCVLFTQKCSTGGVLTCLFVCKAFAKHVQSMFDMRPVHSKMFDRWRTEAY